MLHEVRRLVRLVHGQNTLPRLIARKDGPGLEGHASDPAEAEAVPQPLPRGEYLTLLHRQAQGDVVVQAALGGWRR